MIDPQEAKTVSLTLTLSEPLTGALTIGGPSLPVTLRPGQEARLTFEGAAGQRASLGVTEVNFGTGDNVTYINTQARRDRSGFDDRGAHQWR